MQCASPYHAPYPTYKHVIVQQANMQNIKKVNTQHTNICNKFAKYKEFNKQTCATNKNIKVQICERQQAKMCTVQQANKRNMRKDSLV